MSRKLLLVGRASPATGLGRMTRKIAGGLSTDLDVHVLGLDRRNGSMPTAPRPSAWTLHSNPDRFDVYGQAALADLVGRLRPDLLLFFDDFWVISRHRQATSQTTARPRQVAYFPVDGAIRSPGSLAKLRDLDAVVVYNEFARREVQQAARRAELPATDALHDPRVVPHGIDVEGFRPLTDAELFFGAGRHEARRRLFPERPELNDAFLVLNANRNQPRKRIDLTLRTFARFLDRSSADDAYLYLHMANRDGPFYVTAEARRLGIEQRILGLGEDDEHPAVDDEGLALIYNACDVGLNTSMGEGWGLVSFEHAATGAPQVVPEHSSCAELWEGAAELVAVEGRGPLGQHLEGREIRVPQAVVALERLYHEPERRATMSRAAYRNATREEYGWPRVIERWREALDL